jgi:cytochrome c oxidase subunit II
VRKGIVQLVAIGLVIGVAVTLVAVLFQWLPTSASEEFDRIQDIYWFATVMSIVIFSLVGAVIVYSVWKWRVPLDDDADGPPIHGNTALEIVWTAVPAILVIALGIVSAFVLPVKREAKFTMESVDVIHSFWVPNFGQKMDAVPGIETTILVTPTRTGEFAVICTELCGLGHATMRAKARVVTQAEFDKWVKAEQA